MTDRWTIRVATDFSRTPGARFREDGPFSGEALLEDIVVPRLRDAIASGAVLTLDFDDLAGVAESFLAELFEGLARRFSREQLVRHLSVVSTDDPHILTSARAYMRLDAPPALELLSSARAAGTAAISVFQQSAMVPLSVQDCRRILEELRLASSAIGALGRDPEVLASPFWSESVADAFHAVGELRRALTSSDRFPSDGLAPSSEERTRGAAAYDALAAILNSLTHLIERGVSRPESVFISYAHDSAEHTNQVFHLAKRLWSEGVNCQIDRFISSPAEGWPLWMERAVAAAAFVIVVGSPRYLKRWNKEESPGVGLGASWEAVLTRQELYEEHSNNEKFIPVLFDGDDLSSLPTPLRPYTRYQLPGSYDDLYRRLTNQPIYAPGRLGPRRIFDR